MEKTILFLKTSKITVLWGRSVHFLSGLVIIRVRSSNPNLATRDTRKTPIGPIRLSALHSKYSIVSELMDDLFYYTLLFGRSGSPVTCFHYVDTIGLSIGGSQLGAAPASLTMYFSFLRALTLVWQRQRPRTDCRTCSPDQGGRADFDPHQVQ